MDKEIVTTTEAAKLLGVSVRTAQLLIEGGTIPSWKTPGGHRRVYRRDVLAVIPGASHVPALASARVVLLAQAERLVDYEAALAKASGCAVDAYGDVPSALIAIGTRLPAAVVVEAERGDPARLSLLRSLGTNPALGATRILAVGCPPPERGDAADGLQPGRIRFVDDLAALPEAAASAVRGAAGPLLPAADPPAFPIPGNEGQRLLALERSGLVDTPPEDAFDRLTWLAARSLDAPIALLTLLTRNRQWFKSRQGLDMIETPRGWAFCNHTILRPGIMIAADLAADERFADNPAVAGDLGFRFYAGCPVVDPDGFALGSLCVIDTRPRELDDGQRQILVNLAALASDEIRLRLLDRQVRRAHDMLDRKGG